MMKQPLVINFTGGPGAGKSTAAAQTFALLKYSGVNCELITEYAKDKVWEQSLKVLENQVYVLGKQYHRMASVGTQVDVIVTDSPLLLSLVYGAAESAAFKALVLDLHHRFNNWNFFMERCRAYSPVGRLQTEPEARLVDDRVLLAFSVAKVPVIKMPAVEATPVIIAAWVEHFLEQGNVPEWDVTNTPVLA